MSIFSRSFHIGIKTTSGYYGTMFCAWINNADALSVIPTKPSFLINKIARIIEGFYGISNGTASNPSGSANVKFTNSYGISGMWNYVSTNNVNMNVNLMANACGGTIIPSFIQSYTANGHYNNTSDTVTAYYSGFTPLGTWIGDIFNVGSYPAINTWSNSGLAAPSAYYLEGSNPGFYLEDVYVASPWTPDASEVTIVAAMPNPSNITLQQALDAVTAYSTILLNTTTGLPASGFAVIDSEVFQYTGISGGNTLTGVTRGYNASPQRIHILGNQVFLGGWFVKINGGFLYMGTSRP
jgi:hypothetical protein